MTIAADGSVEGGLINTLNGEAEEPTGDIDTGGADIITDVVDSSSSGGFFGAAGPSVFALAGFLLFRRRLHNNKLVR